MSSELREKLRADIQATGWVDFREFLTRGTLIVVSENLDIAEVGEAVAEDRRGEVEAWIQQSYLTKPTEAQVAAWEVERNRRFDFLIVQPYVLIQLQSN